MAFTSSEVPLPRLRLGEEEIIYYDHISSLASYRDMPGKDKKVVKNRVILEVVDIPGRCPIYSLGDKIVIDPHPNEEVSLINLEETDAICTRVLGGALLSYHAWFERAQPSSTDAQNNPWQRALGPDYSKCPMVGPPYSTCGYVLFKVYGSPLE